MPSLFALGKISFPACPVTQFLLPVSVLEWLIKYTPNCYTPVPNKTATLIPVKCHTTQVGETGCGEKNHKSRKKPGVDVPVKYMCISVHLCPCHNFLSWESLIKSIQDFEGGKNNMRGGLCAFFIMDFRFLCCMTGPAVIYTTCLIWQKKLKLQE